MPQHIFVFICRRLVENKAKALHNEWENLFPWMPWSVSLHRLAEHIPEMMLILPATLNLAMLSEVRTN